jgi:hypothetical protein
MSTTGSGPIETTSLTTSDTAALAGAGSTAVGGRGRLAAGWHFARHLLEMIIAMLVGMAALSAAISVLGAPPGYNHLLVEYGLMGAAMAAPMVAWMRFRGHPWSDGAEMTAAMLLPIFALIGPAALGLLRADSHMLMMLAHVAMFAGMVALMVYRRDRYTHGPQRHAQG